jgi:hypothetical protein
LAFSRETKKTGPANETGLDDVIEAYRKMSDELGRGYQTLINEALRETLGTSQRPVDAKTLRRILREELKKAG